MRGVFFGVEATLYSFTLPQRFWQVTERSLSCTEIPTAIELQRRLRLLRAIAKAIALFTPPSCQPFQIANLGELLLLQLAKAIVNTILQ